MKKLLELFATTPKGLELLLVEELKALGANDAREKLAGVEFSGDMALAYKACLWSRLANRILLKVAVVPAATPDELYAGVQAVNWSKHLNLQSSFSVKFVCAQSTITHTLFGAQKVKDAIVDQFRDSYGERPDVARDQPDVSVYVYLYRNQATISIDLSGESLHKRGYRLAGGAAPLKENLAAAILLRAGWPAIAKQKGMLLDPMCGSATLLIEGAMQAADMAPGLQRDYYGFLGWKKHQPALWQKLLNDAEERYLKGSVNLPTMIGYDEDPSAIKYAFENIERAGLLGKIHVEKSELANLKIKHQEVPGLLITNPPYGERLGEIEDLKPLYTLLGDKLKQELTGWKAAVFTGNPELGKVMGIRAKKYYALFNGAIPCQLLLFDVLPEKFIDRSIAAENKRRILAAQKTQTDEISDAVKMFINRLKKNYKHMSKQAKRTNADLYRVYDADLPDYAFAIDIRNNGVYVTEYQAPRSIEEAKVVKRRHEMLSVLPDILEVEAASIFFSIQSLEKK